MEIGRQSVLCLRTLAVHLLLLLLLLLQMQARVTRPARLLPFSLSLLSRSSSEIDWRSAVDAVAGRQADANETVSVITMKQKESD